MERLILNKLLAWKNSPYRKPLILKGVRQVGKTWILKEFSRRYCSKVVLTGISPFPLFLPGERFLQFLPRDSAQYSFRPLAAPL